jgi:hypothetical protein
METIRGTGSIPQQEGLLKLPLRTEWVYFKGDAIYLVKIYLVCPAAGFALMIFDRPCLTGNCRVSNA